MQATREKNVKGCWVVEDTHTFANSTDQGCCVDVEEVQPDVLSEFQSDVYVQCHVCHLGSEVSSPTYRGTTFALLGSPSDISIPALQTGHCGSSRCRFNHLYKQPQLHNKGEKALLSIGKMQKHCVLASGVCTGSLPHCTQDSRDATYQCRCPQTVTTGFSGLFRQMWQMNRLEPSIVLAHGSATFTQQLLALSFSSPTTSSFLTFSFLSVMLPPRGGIADKLAGVLAQCAVDKGSGKYEFTNARFTNPSPDGCRAAPVECPSSAPMPRVCPVASCIFREASVCGKVSTVPFQMV